MSTPLPKADSDAVQHFASDDLNSLSAYQICLDLEKEFTTMENVRLVRILGYLLLYAPNRAVRNEVANCIHSCKYQSDLINVGAHFECNVIVPFMKYKSRTPISSDHPSRPSFETTKMEAEITKAPKNHQDAKRQVALVRDNWRCVVTGVLHRDAPAEIINASTPPVVAAYIECAHIIPEATFFSVGAKDDKNTKARCHGFLHRSGDLKSSTPKLDCSASILAVLRRFHCHINSFTEEKVHSLTNVITMEKNIHDVFDRLELYFEATPVKNRYLVKYFKPFRVDPQQHDSVTFSTQNPETLPDPSPELLALHATCCKVAQLSGSAEFIDTVYDDLEQTGVLASDGTSGDFLRFKLLSLANSSTMGVEG